MQDHFIKNVDDLFLCMTFICDRSRASTKVCTLYATVNTNTGTMTFWWRLFLFSDVKSLMLHILTQLDWKIKVYKTHTGTVK